PDGVSLSAAAGLLIAYGTSHLALADRARLAPGDRLLVTGAAGGVGKTAVELGVAMGAHVTGVARGAEKLDRMRTLGAHAIYDSDDPTLVDTLRAQDRFNVVYETIGGTLFQTAMRCTAPEGRILTIGFAGGDVPQIPANHLMVKNISVQGLYWGGVLSYAPDKVFNSLQQVFDLVAQGKLDPTPDHEFAFDDAPAALDFLKQRRSTGKVVVNLRPQPT
ncbi:MAG: zinc-binding dehydrogenase, partial [Pseudomonadota bacterium]